MDYSQIIDDRGVGTYGERKKEKWALEEPGGQRNDENRWWIECSLWLVMVTTKVPLNMSIGPLWVTTDCSECTGFSVLRIHVQSTINGIPSPWDSCVLAYVLFLLFCVCSLITIQEAVKLNVTKPLSGCSIRSRILAQPHELCGGQLFLNTEKETN